ncbi:ubiquitin-like modifier-activating enzyme 6 isoform X2 [Corticium candelabrum]|uniref:ubiquitin-like modifier-activating enzyme 6 isoform X2 n=1 Tax=Corticium candelabrum TaxID=121492 RepID=UPI002E26D384|nr:ubiquitin-like modifier-activating enzyme 6 isoform X2 [Corticium candelabrum]
MLPTVKVTKCVVLTEAPLQLQLKVNEFCRLQSPQIKFISGEVRGVFCWIFCDFGDEFSVLDATGEEPKETFISNITKANPGVVATLENQMHGFESGDYVTFREVQGMTELNDTIHRIEVLTPYTFSIGDTSGVKFQPYIREGVALQVKVPKKISFHPLKQQLCSPTILTVDFAKFEVGMQLHVAMLTLDLFQSTYNRLPRPNYADDATEVVALAGVAIKRHNLQIETFDTNLITKLAQTAAGCLPAFTASLGGVVAQEVLKSLTGKFSPLVQWLYLDAIELLNELDMSSLQPRGDRYDPLRLCVGEALCGRLAGLKMFMVGCGAIGCEMLKNYAMMGIGVAPNGLVTVTDNDLIEKSNLNRQFLFRSRHIQQPKSTVAAAATQEINPEIRIDSHQHKVCPQTEKTMYNDSFFLNQDLIVNALDNVEARRYMDSRCVTNQRALLESGTMGAKGHVQVIVPHLTECYSSQQDPPDQDVPYCTLKSFPANIEHTIQWARDKFESQFFQKPSLFNKFWEKYKPPAVVLRKLEAGERLEGVKVAAKLLANRPEKWSDCVLMARVKFEKYFNHKAKNLIHAFPLDTKMKDGSLFWQSPKRPPVPLNFDFNEPDHLSFVTSFAKLYAQEWGMDIDKSASAPMMDSFLKSCDIPEFKPTGKRIETDESVKKPEKEDIAGSEGQLEKCKGTLGKILSNKSVSQEIQKMKPHKFDKDQEGNFHIDFINAAANCRARMYGIETSDKLQTKRIAGRIVPAIATTTSAVAGLVSIELLKVVKGGPIDQYRNVFLNLALPLMVLSEPAAAERTEIRQGLSYTLWDKWEVRGHANYSLREFLKHFVDRHGLEPAMVVHGVKMIYVPVMPGHRKRLPERMIKLINPPAGTEYVDLTVSFSIPGEDEDKPIPPVRYFFQ